MLNKVTPARMAFAAQSDISQSDPQLWSAVLTGSKNSMARNL